MFADVLAAATNKDAISVSHKTRAPQIIPTDPQCDHMPFTRLNIQIIIIRESPFSAKHKTCLKITIHSYRILDNDCILTAPFAQWYGMMLR